MTAVGAAPMPGRGRQSAQGRKRVGHFPGRRGAAQRPARQDRDEERGGSEGRQVAGSDGGGGQLRHGRVDKKSVGGSSI